MSRKSLEIFVEPKVLIWARESMGLSIQAVAKKLKVSEDIVSKWESKQKKPTLNQIEKFAKLCKRPLAVFFLSEPPEELPLPKDFRTLPPEKRKPFSLATRLAIRRARRLQSLASELAKSLNRELISRIGRISLSDDPEVVTLRMREQLNVEVQTQFNWEDENEAFNEWKKMMERCGILVLQIGMPLEETRGFSLTDGLPVIVLNYRDSIHGRIFSLFHEYAHILLNNCGVCNMEDQDHLTDEAISVEKFCNHFAGAFLVQKGALLDHDLIRGRYLSECSDEMLGKIAKSFKVSREVILRRLLILGLTPEDFYRRKREEWEERRPIRWGHHNPPKRCIQENGVPFVSLVLESHKEEKITYSDVADYLAIRTKHLPKIEELIGSKV